MAKLKEDTKNLNLVYLKETVQKREVKVSRVYLYSKRLVDILIASSGLIILSPMMLFIGILIKVFSPGPLFFRQKRVGLKGEIFDVVKFRTMHTRDAYPELFQQVENDQPFVKIKNDPRIFPFGHILRKVSMDELPQLFNILWGNMSLIGPRPLVEEEVSLCDEDQICRLLAKPGLTGWAQINGRTDVTFDGLMDMDIYYIQNQSVLFDIFILLKTVKVVVTREGAY